MIPGKSCAGPPEPPLGEFIHTLTGITRVDFRRYKEGFLQRQVRRQVLRHRLTGSRQYLQQIQTGRHPARVLINHLNVHVTRFFRDPSLFDLLERDLLPRVWRRHWTRGTKEFRIWVIGCSTGNEAYSVAISLLESVRPDLQRTPVHIFATDLDEIVIEAARRGEFPAQDLDPLQEEIRSRYFVPAGENFRVVPALRRLITFGTHDLLQDPLIHHLDMIFCRNVLIFLNREAQEEIFSRFHQALNPGGLLVLGRAESPSRRSSRREFSPLCRRERIYEKTGPAPAPEGATREEGTP